MLSYLALGDSYTIGEGVDAAGCWPLQLAAALRAEGIALDDPRILATTGWTTDELITAMDLAEPPLVGVDFVTLLIGVNNQYRGRSVVDYGGDFTELLLRAKCLANGRADRVLVLSIPDWGVTPFAMAQGRDRAHIASELDDYNAAAKAICDGCGVAFVDITAINRARGGEVDMLVDDGLHPSAAMYREWTALALPTARELLDSGTTAAP